jgi:hypothetical protein
LGAAYNTKKESPYNLIDPTALTRPTQYSRNVTQIQQFEKQANKLNKSGVGDCAAFYLTKKQT